MKKSTVLFTLVAALFLCGCRSSKVKISGRFVGNEAKTVYLEQVTPLAQSAIDSTLLDAQGNYRFLLKTAPQSPGLYNIVYNGERIPLFLAAGDRVEVGSVGNVVRNYTVAGSEESELLRRFYQAFVTGAQNLDKLAQRFSEAGLTEAARQSLIKIGRAHV